MSYSLTGNKTPRYEPKIQYRPDFSHPIKDLGFDDDEEISTQIFTLDQRVKDRIRTLTREYLFPYVYGEIAPEKPPQLLLQIYPKGEKEVDTTSFRNPLVCVVDMTRLPFIETLLKKLHQENNNLPQEAESQIKDQAFTEYVAYAAEKLFFHQLGISKKNICFPVRDQATFMLSKALEQSVEFDFPDYMALQASSYELELNAQIPPSDLSDQEIALLKDEHLSRYSNDNEESVREWQKLLQQKMQERLDAVENFKKAIPQSAKSLFLQKTAQKALKVVVSKTLDARSLKKARILKGAQRLKASLLKEDDREPSFRNPFRPKSNSNSSSENEA